MLEIETEIRRKSFVMGYGYLVTRLTPRELALASPVRVRQYLLGLITGGALDCFTEWGIMPWQLYNMLEKRIPLE